MVHIVGVTDWEIIKKIVFLIIREVSESKVEGLYLLRDFLIVGLFLNSVCGVGGIPCEIKNAKKNWVLYQSHSLNNSFIC